MQLIQRHLRLTVEEKRDRSGRSVRLILEGELVGPGVKELERTWNRFCEESAPPVSVDLCAVTFISQNGESCFTGWTLRAPNGSRAAC